MPAKTNAKTKAKTPKVTAREQGFPDVYLGPSGKFRPGYDARAKSDLIAVINGSGNSKPLATFTWEQAMALLKARGWLGFLKQKQAANKRPVKTAV